MKLLYFAWLKEKLGVAEETVSLPNSVATVGDLLDWLEDRGPEFKEVISQRSTIRVAVNQEFAQTDTRICSTDEVAVFPPVTGG